MLASFSSARQVTLIYEEDARGSEGRIACLTRFPLSLCSHGVERNGEESLFFAVEIRRRFRRCRQTSLLSVAFRLIIFRK